LFREPEIPFGWGALIESEGELVLVRKPLWHEVTSAKRLKLLERIAAAGTRLLNQTVGNYFRRRVRSPKSSLSVRTVRRHDIGHPESQR